MLTSERPDELSVIPPAKMDEVELKPSIASELNLTTADIAELIKNPIRSIVNAIFASIEDCDYGTAKQVHIRRIINPLELEVFFVIGKHLYIEHETNELCSYDVASIAMNTCFGPIAFTIDTIELEILKENKNLMTSCENTITGRTIVDYIYDALNNPCNTHLSYTDAIREKIDRYLYRK